MNLKNEPNAIYLMDDGDDVVAEITFPDLRDGVVAINHTYVDDSLRGQGIADKLTGAAYDSIKEQNKKCVLVCPYAVKWFSEHPEKNDIVVNG